jgi:hypothetical protein
MNKHIKKNWETFAKVAIPLDAPEFQLDQLRKSFYAGVCMMFGDINEKMEDPNTSDTEGGEFLKEINDEILEFLELYLVKKPTS